MPIPYPSRSAFTNTLRVAVPGLGAFIASEASAQTVFAIDQQFGASQSLYIDMHDGSFAFGDSTDAELGVFFNLGFSTKPAVMALTGSGGRIHLHNYSYGANLAAGTLIDAALMAVDADNNGLTVELNSAGDNDANWAAGTQGYVGFNFVSEGTTFFGYADITYTSDEQLYVGNVGYQADGILAGSGTPSAIPEPSTYAAMAGLLAGSAALLRRRQQRKAAAAA